MLSKKRKLNDFEKIQAEIMLKEGKSFGQISRYFGVTKPTIKKALNLW